MQSPKYSLPKLVEERWNFHWTRVQFPPGPLKVDRYYGGHHNPVTKAELGSVTFINVSDSPLVTLVTSVSVSSLTQGAL